MADMFDEIWQRRIDPVLAAETWTGQQAYNAAQYLEAPLEYAYGASGSDVLQASFRTYFQAFSETGYEADVGWLSRGQHGLLVSRFVRLEEDRAGGSTALTETLTDQLSAEAAFEWSDQTELDWTSDPSVGRAASIAYKLATGALPVSDGDLHLLALMNDLAAIRASRGEAIPQFLLDAVSLTEDVLTAYGSYDATGGWQFEPGAWNGHASSQEADWTGEGPIPVAPLPADLGWDVSHAARFPAWIDSFERGFAATNRDAADVGAIRDGLTLRMLDRVLVADPMGSGAWLTTNFLDGSNGVYRLGYQSFSSGDGYAPFGLSGTFLMGQWASLDDADITATYADLLNLGGFTPDLLEYFNEPVRRTDETGIFDWRDLIESGDVRLWLALAADQTAVPEMVSVPDIGDFFEIAAGGVLSGATLFAGLAAAPSDGLEIIDIGAGIAAGGLTLGGISLAADQVHAISVADLADLSYRAGGTGQGDRLYWRLDAGADGLDWTPWASFDIMRQNVPGSVTFGTIEGEEGDRVTLGEVATFSDPDGDAAMFYHLWYDAAGDMAGFEYAGVGLQAEINVTVTAAQFAETELVLMEGVSYYLRANDGGDWSDWQRLPVVVGNVAPQWNVPDQSQVNGLWLAFDPRDFATDANGDALVSVELWDDEGANSWWADGGLVDASLGYVTQNLDDIWLRADATASDQTLWVRGSDGSAWSSWDRFEFQTIGNAAMVPDVADQSIVTGGWRRLSDVLGYFDADGDTLGGIELWDDEGAANWWADGGMVDARQGYRTNDLSDVWFRGDDTGGVQTLWVRGHDGKQWGVWDAFELSSIANARPMVSVADQDMAAGETRALQDVITYLDADGDLAVQYQIWDDEGVDNWLVDGVAVEVPTGLIVPVDADISFTNRDGGAEGTLWVRAYDGQQWGQWDAFELL